MRSSAMPGSRPSCARTEASSRRRAPGRCRPWSSSATSEATSTPIRPGRTARTRSKRWSPARSRRATTYYAVCDHSHRLRDGRLEQQGREIDALNERLPIRVLKGVEVNIRAGGELDLADHELATLDWVVASVHNSFDKDPTGRVLAAMESPYVDCIGHLTGRKIGRRDPAPIDLERVIEGALATGTFLEINSQPDRLDLSDVHARAAREAGLKLVIDSDGHRLAALDYVELGVGQARRAWLTKDDVVNTRTWKQVERIRKRRPG